MRWFSLLCLTVACATTQVAPSDKLAFDYTQAYLRRDGAEMQTLGTSGVEHPLPSAFYSTRKAIRTCPAQDAAGGPEAKAILVLLGNPTNQQFVAMKVTVAHYGQQWLVIDAQLVNGPTGVPLIYSRACQPIYGTQGGAY